MASFSIQPSPQPERDADPFAADTGLCTAIKTAQGQIDTAFKAWESKTIVVTGTGFGTSASSDLAIPMVGELRRVIDALPPAAFSDRQATALENIETRLDMALLDRAHTLRTDLGRETENEKGVVRIEVAALKRLLQKAELQHCPAPNSDAASKK